MIFLVTTLVLSTTVMLIVLQKTLVPLLQKAKMNKRLAKEGTLAEAVLLNMQQTGIYVNNLPQVKLLMQVHPKTGRNFITEVKEVLSFIDLSQLQIGNTLQILYNPSNIKEAMIVRN